MGFRDRYGLPLTTSSAEAAQAYVEGLDLARAHLPGADARFARAAEADEGFALPRLARAYLHWGPGQDDLGGVEQARALAARATRRERQQVDVVSARMAGRPDAVAGMRAHLAEFPADALVVQLTVFALGFDGTEADPRASIHRLLSDVAGAYGGDWWLPGMLAMSSQELGRLDEARHLASVALDRHPRAAGGAHPMTHVFYERGEHADGIAFLDPWLAGYDTSGTFRHHLLWHLALFELAEGNLERVEQLMTRDMLPTTPEAFTGLEDIASLLWRQWLYRAATGPLDWAAVLDLADAVAAQPGFSFHDAHAALAFAGAGEERRLAALVAAQRRLADGGHRLAGLVVAPLAEGVGALAAGDSPRAVECLEPVQPLLARLGGSHVQREVFEDTLVVAYLRAARVEPARALLAARLQRRPSARDQAWLATTPKRLSSPVGRTSGQALDRARA